MAIKKSYFSLFVLFFSFITLSLADIRFPTTLIGGRWALLHPNIGISAMHVQLLYNNKLIIFDRTDAGQSNLTFPSIFIKNNSNLCRNITINNTTTVLDCTAHSILYDLESNTFRPLFVKTDTFCSSGAVDSTGTLIQTGGYNGGDKVIRKFTPCNSNCEWVELQHQENLTQRRWYASNQVLPDGRIIVVGGRNVFTYEFFPKKPRSHARSFYLRFLADTRDPFEENNLYPFLHLLPDGNLFIFANRRSMLLDYTRNRVIKEYPTMPGEEKRNYPSTGSSVLLPIRLDSHRNGTNITVEVMICGGAPAGSFIKAVRQRVFIEASGTCGRIRVTDPEPEWVIEEMPMARVMSDMIVLPSGDVLIVNGAGNGTAGWENAVNPIMNPVLYRVDESDPNQKFVVLNPGLIPRMYHSSAVLLPDGRVLVGGSNPHVRYNFTAEYPTDLSIEAFYPPYLAPQYAALRPTIIAVETMGDTVSYDGVFSVTFGLTAYRVQSSVYVGLVTPSFATHSVAMNQRLVVLETVEVMQLSTFDYKITVVGPTGANVAPPGFYMMFVVHAGIPSHAVWIKVGGF